MPLVEVEVGCRTGRTDPSGGTDTPALEELEPARAVRPLGRITKGAELLLKLGSAAPIVEWDDVPTEAEAPAEGAAVVTPADAEAPGVVTETEAAPVGPAETAAEVPTEPAGVGADAERAPAPVLPVVAPVEVPTEPVGVEADVETPAAVPPLPVETTVELPTPPAGGKAGAPTPADRLPLVEAEPETFTEPAGVPTEAEAPTETPGIGGGLTGSPAAAA